MPGKDHWNSAFFCGTGAVLRREALEPSGGQLTGSITEDMHTSLALQAAGWKTVYLNELLVTGLAPMDFASYASQRLRWAEGNLKIVRHMNPLTVRGLTVAQRISYFASVYHWTIGFAKLIFYVAPPLILFTGEFPIAKFDRQFFVIYGAHLATLVGSYKVFSRGTGRLVMDELFNMANFFTLLVAAKRFLFGRGEGKFVVTSKRGGAPSDAVVLPQYLLIGFTVLALVWSALGLGFGVTEDVVGAGVAAFWAVYNLLLMVGVVGFALRPVQKRSTVRFRAAVPVDVSGDLRQRLGVTIDVSEGGCTLLWPEALAVGNRLDLRLHFGAHVIECPGTVRAVYGRRSSNWFAHGIQFTPPDLGTVDRLADAIYNMTVPAIFSRLNEPSWTRRLWRSLVTRLRYGVHVRPVRHESFMPVRVQSGAAEFVAMTRDLSLTGISLVSPRPLAIGALVSMRLASGAESWTCHATVVRQHQTAAPRPEFSTWHVALHIDRSLGRRHDAPVPEAA